MNKWQEYFISTYYNGKKPRDKMGKTEFELLGKVKETVTVHFPNETKTFSVTLEECNIPSGIISVSVLASNLYLWSERGYKITTR